MRITYSETVVMYNLNKIHGERTIYSLYHLFQGKRSSQTIQDAHLYQLTPFFHSYPSMTRSWLENTVEALIKKGLVEEIAETKVILSANGKEVLENQLAHEPLPLFLNGWKYHQVTDVFWERLTLLIQVCSNLVHREKSFIPVRNKKDTLTWVKQFISQQKEDRYQLAERLYRELVLSLDNPNTRPELIVVRFTGFGKIGLTPVQAAELAGVESVHYYFEFLNALHALFDRILEEPSCYPLLTGLIKHADQEVPLTISTEKTYRFLQKGYLIEEIAAARKLKESTIEDHIVEIILTIKDFSIDPYVAREKQQRILQAARKISARQLKQIKERVQDASYFEIRLVLGKFGDVEWN
ncbi:MAG TPA: RQC domain-containing protein [Bacillus bacterium]|nr:RQC domain-containing protein [Bacillus sp. (in: firmicutes)]